MTVSAAMARIEQMSNADVLPIAVGEHGARQRPFPLLAQSNN
jgi:hypothetical protein